MSQTCIECKECVLAGEDVHIASDGSGMTHVKCLVAPVHDWFDLSKRHPDWIKDDKKRKPFQPPPPSSKPLPVAEKKPVVSQKKKTVLLE